LTDELLLHHINSIEIYQLPIDNCERKIKSRLYDFNTHDDILVNEVIRKSRYEVNDYIHFFNYFMKKYYRKNNYIKTNMDSHVINSDLEYKSDTSTIRKNSITDHTLIYKYKYYNLKHNISMHVKSAIERDNKYKEILFDTNKYDYWINCDNSKLIMPNNYAVGSNEE
jgi:hypothetical protein